MDARIQPGATSTTTTRRLAISRRPVALPFALVAIGFWCIVVFGIQEDDWQKSVVAALVASLLTFAFWRLRFRSPIWIEFHGDELEVGLRRRSYRVSCKEIEDIAQGDYRGSFVSYTVFVRGGRTFTLAEREGALLTAWRLERQREAERSAWNPGSIVC